MSNDAAKNEVVEKLEEAAEEVGSLTRADLAVVKAAHPLGETMMGKALGEASELADQPPLVAASLATLVAGLALRQPRIARTGLRMLLAHGLATGVKTVIKDNFDRYRPRKVAEEGEAACAPGESKDGDDRSLPSGHSAGAVAVARAIVRDNPAAAPIAYPLAATASLVQITRKAHFPTDVVAGVLVGLVAEAVSSRVMDRVLGGRRR